MLDTEPLLKATDFPSLAREQLNTLQVNLGYLCNLSCTHCHVNAGPKRKELMTLECVDHVIEYLKRERIGTLDVTGGAPEMNPHFRYLVEAATELGVQVIDRCNLTILLEPGYEDLADFLVKHKVVITASLPCYTPQNVAEQRGKGVFEQSIEALQLLNSKGYGKTEELPLHLVYNPNGHFLPPPQQQLEQDYKRELMDNYGVEFNSLLTITNMPISRFGSMLLSKGLWDEYLDLLKGAYLEENLHSVMCKSLISIDYQGYLYDCDFNQMLNWPIEKQIDYIGTDRPRLHISDLISGESLPVDIKVGQHCYGCTAGQGSSCSGALA